MPRMNNAAASPLASYKKEYGKSWTKYHYKMNKQGRTATRTQGPPGQNNHKIISTHMLVHKVRYRAAAYIIMAFCTLLATGIVLTWGINTPIALLFGLVAVLALASWLFNREMETSLNQARRAQQALLRQKATLELQAQRRTRQLRESQREELQQMYRVTELGHIGISLLHDLANNLTALQLEIEELEGEYNSASIEHVRGITNYLGEIIESTRSRIHGTPHKRSFDIIEKTNETIAFLRYKAKRVAVDILWQPPATSWRYHADPVSYSQVLTLLIGNAIDACGGSPANIRREVTVAIGMRGSRLTITVGSWSKIENNTRNNLFKPFETSKKTGMGIGLYIAKQTVASQLDGTLALRNTNHYTEFTISLPMQQPYSQN